MELKCPRKTRLVGLRRSAGTLPSPRSPCRTDTPLSYGQHVAQARTMKFIERILYILLIYISKYVSSPHSLAVLYHKTRPLRHIYIRTPLSLYKPVPAATEGTNVKSAPPATRTKVLITNEREAFNHTKGKHWSVIDLPGTAPAVPTNPTCDS